MKNILIAASILFSISCNKKKMIDTPSAVTTNLTKIAEANFVSNVHSTSGKAIINKDSAGAKSLVLENLSSDSGPDLRLYFSTALQPNNILQVTDDIQNGNKSYVLPIDFEITQKPKLIIWCQQFSVLFGSASFN